MCWQRKIFIKLSAEFMIPQLTFSLRVKKVLMMFDMKIYLSVEIAVIPMVGPSQLKLDWDHQEKVEGYIPIEAFQHQHMAIGSGTWELPVCVRCFLGYSCKTHKHN